MLPIFDMSKKRLHLTVKHYDLTKESYSRVNESKQQLNSFIIYDLDSIARVNERKKEEKKVKLTKM